MSGYRPILCEPAADFILFQPRRRQRRIMEDVRKIARQPLAPSDYTTVDAEGRSIEHRLEGDYAYSFWIDHSQRHVMVTAIESAD